MMQPEPMTRDLAINFLSEGQIEQFNQHRARGDSVSLQGARLLGLNIKNANLSKINFSGANLTGTTLTACDIDGAVFYGANLQELKCGHGTSMQGCDLRRANLQRAKFVTVDFTNAIFAEPSDDSDDRPSPDLKETTFTGAILAGADFRYARFNPATSFVGKSNLMHTNFRNCDLNGMRFDGAVLTGAVFAGAKLQGAYLDNTDLRAANFSDADCQHMSAQDARLNHAMMSNVDVRFANFFKSDFSFADMRGAKVNTATSLEHATMDGCKMELFTLESLGSEYGKLTPADRMVMDIEDGVASLRYQYSGFLSYLHGIALIAFIFPYAWFLGRLWIAGRFMSDASNSLTLWEALLRFIVSGGEHWQGGWQLSPRPFTAFCVALAYNVFRAVLLAKTKYLELQQQARGVPVRFSLTNTWWGRLNRFTTWLFYANLASVAYHTWHFLNQRVPVSG